MNTAPSACLEVVHATHPGRARLRVPGLYRNQAALLQLENGLSGEHGICLSSANVLTATILVTYSPGLTLTEMVVLLTRQIEKLVPHKPAGAPASIRSMASPTIAPRPRRAPNPARAQRPHAAALPAAARSSQIWHQRTARETLEAFDVNFNRGLSLAAAAERLVRCGPNALPEPERRSALAIFLDQFKSLPILLLGGSAVLSAATGGLADAAVILAVVLINAGIGYVTESQAERMISSLTSTPRPPVPVIREARVLALSARELVPGDILLLTPGCLVAADARLIYAKDLSVDESALTGESLPVAKSAEILCNDQTAIGNRLNMVHMGTAVTGGSATAVVVTTGQATELGLIQALVGETRPPETPMQRQLDRLGKQLVWGSLAICGGVFALGLLRGYGFLPMLRAAVSLAVAAVPEGLPTVATTTLALGIRDMRLASHSIVTVS
jgi:Ca2+-transporting ATPase